MAKYKISIADAFYDRCCMGYTLKARDIGIYSAGALVGRTSRISSYAIENVGTVTIIRAEAPMGTEKVESCIFVPTKKDAPILMIDDVKRWFKKESLSINIVKTQISELCYRQFEPMAESFAKLSDADVPTYWYNDRLVRGSVAKAGEREELAAMLEEYMNAYLRIVDFAEPCDPAEKAKKTKEFSKNFLTEESPSAAVAGKGLGDRTEEFLDTVVFPL